MKDQNRFKAYHYLDEPVRIIGMTPFDELIPALFFAAIGFIITGAFMGIVICAVTYIAIIKIIKAKHGDKFMRIFMFWRLNPSSSKQMYPHTPPAAKRFMIGRR